MNTHTSAKCTECGAPTSWLGAKLCDGCWEMKRNGKYDALKTSYDVLVKAMRLIKSQAEAEGPECRLIREYAVTALAKAGAL